MLVMKLVEHRLELVSYARNMVGDYAEDVVSDLSEELLRKRLNAPEKYLPLLKWYLRRRCIDHIRASPNTCELYENVELTNEPYIDNELIEAMERELRNLDPVVTRILVLNRVERVTAKEIAEGTGISIGRIKGIIFKARKQVRENATRRT